MKENYIAKLTDKITSPQRNFQKLRAKLKSFKYDFSLPNPLLHFAVIAKDEEIIGLLLELGADINGVDKFNRTPLHCAVQKEDAFIVKLLLNKGAQLTFDDNGNTPLHEAIKNEFTEAVSLFCQQPNTNLNAFNSNKETPVTLALRSQNPSLLPILLENDFNPIDLQIIQKLIEDDSQTKEIRCGAYLHLVAHGSIEQLQRLVSKMDFRYRDSKEHTAIGRAIIAGREDVISWLILQQDQSFWENPVLLAIAYDQKELLSKMLLSKDAGGYGFSLNDKSDNLGLRPVNTAIKYGKTALLDDLVKPVAKGGFGLNFNSHSAIVSLQGNNIDLQRKLISLHIHLWLDEADLRKLLEAAICYHQYEMFIELTTPSEKGGFGLHNLVAQLGSQLLFRAIINGDKRIFRTLTDPIEMGGHGLEYAKITNINPQPTGFQFRPTLSSRADLDFDIHNFNPVITAIEFNSRLLPDLLKPLEFSGYGLSLETEDRYGTPPVIAAIEYGHWALLRKLVTPLREGGYGLTFNVKPRIGHGPFVTAMRFHKNIIWELLNPTAQGGFGLTPDAADLEEGIETLLRDDNVSILTKLLASKESGGYGYTYLADINFQDRPSHKFIFMYQFNYCLKHFGITEACNWAENALFTLAHQYDYEIFVKILFNVYLDLCQNYYSAGKHKEIAVIVNAYEQLKPNQSHFFLGKVNSVTEHFVEAYEHYLACFKNNRCPEKEAAGFELANLILAGNVILASDGTIDKMKPIEQNKHAHDFIPATKDHFKVTQMRAIMAYEYLHDCTSREWLFLKRDLQNILSGAAHSASDENKFWSSSVVKAFASYYRFKNAALLQSDYIMAQLNHNYKQVEKKVAKTHFFKKEVVSTHHYCRVLATRLNR